MANYTTYKTKNGTVRHMAVIRRKGTEKKSYSKSFNKISDAKKWATKMESSIQSEELVTNEATKYTFSELVSEYNQNKQGRRARASHVEWWRKEIGNLTLSKITARLVSEKKKILLNSSDSNRVKTRTGSTVNRYLAALSAVMNYARKELYWISGNPLSDVSKCRENSSRERFLTEVERVDLLTACKGIDQTLYEFSLFALSTGARAGEIQKLEWSDIDFDSNLAMLRDTKNGTSRSIPVVGEIRGLLKARRGIGLVFMSNKATIYQYGKPFIAALKAAEIKGARFHDLRRSTGSYLVQNGWTREMVGKLLGHKSLQATQIYTRFEDEAIALQAGKALDELYRS